MARTVTLGVLRSDVRWASDQVGFTARHSDSDLNRAINQSIQTFRMKVTQHGERKYLVSNTGTLASGATSPYAFTQLSAAAWSPQLVKLFGLDVAVNGRIVPLELVPFDMRNDFQRGELGASVTGPPIACAQFGAETFAILPATDGAYAYTAWYLPVSTDLSSDSDTFDGTAGWEQWIVWDVVLKLNTRDTNSKSYQMAQDRQNAVWADIAAACPSKQAGVVRRYDSRELRIDRMSLRRNWVGR